MSDEPKRLQDMTEEELHDLSHDCCVAVDNILPDRTGFFLLFLPLDKPSMVRQGSHNIPNVCAVAILRGLADSIERGLAK